MHSGGGRCHYRNNNIRVSGAGSPDIGIYNQHASTAPIWVSNAWENHVQVSDIDGGDSEMYAQHTSTAAIWVSDARCKCVYVSGDIYIDSGMYVQHALTAPTWGRAGQTRAGVGSQRPREGEACPTRLDSVSIRLGLYGERIFVVNT